MGQGQHMQTISQPSSNIEHLRTLLHKLNDVDHEFHVGFEKLKKEIVDFKPLNGVTSSEEKLGHYESFHHLLLNIAREFK